MVKIQLKHTIRRYLYKGVHYYPGDVLEVEERALTPYMTVLPSPKLDAPTPTVVEEKASPEIPEIPKRKRRAKATSQ